MTKIICPKCEEELVDGKCLFCGYEGKGKSVSDESIENCQHKNIVITYESYYTIPHGWEKEKEKEDIDLGKYFVKEEEVNRICQDCGEQLSD